MPDIFSAPITEIKKAGDVYFKISFIAPQEIYAASKPGMFLMLGFDTTGGEQKLLHPFSIFNAEEKSGECRLSVFFCVRGEFTSSLSEMKPGDVLRVNAPLGNNFPEPDAGSGGLFCMVGGGYGVAPFYFATMRAIDRNIDKKRLHLFYGAKTKADLPLAPELEKLGVNLHLTTEDGSTGEKGLVTEALEGLLDTASDNSGEKPVILSCGPHGLLECSGKIANKNGLECFLSYEAFFACGVGLCRGCAVADKTGSYRIVCCEGPVFTAKEMLK